MIWSEHEYTDVVIQQTLEINNAMYMKVKHRENGCKSGNHAYPGSWGQGVEQCVVIVIFTFVIYFSY